MSSPSSSPSSVPTGSASGSRGPRRTSGSSSRAPPSSCSPCTGPRTCTRRSVHAGGGVPADRAGGLGGDRRDHARFLLVEGEPLPGMGRDILGARPRPGADGSPPLALAVRPAARSGQARLRDGGRRRERRGASLAAIMSSPSFGFRPIGVVAVTDVGIDLGVPVLGSIADLREVLESSGAECVFVAASAVDTEDLKAIARAVRLADVEVGPHELPPAPTPPPRADRTHPPHQPLPGHRLRARRRDLPHPGSRPLHWRRSRRPRRPWVAAAGASPSPSKSEHRKQ